MKLLSITDLFSNLLKLSCSGGVQSIGDEIWHMRIHLKATIQARVAIHGVGIARAYHNGAVAGISSASFVSSPRGQMTLSGKPGNPPAFLLVSAAGFPNFSPADTRFAFDKRWTPHPKSWGRSPAYDTNMKSHSASTCSQQ